MKIYKFCKEFFLNQKKRMFLYITLTLFSVFIGILSPYILGNFIDYLINGKSKYQIYRYCAIFFLINILKVIKNYYISILSVKLQAIISYSLNIKVIKHVQEMSISFVNKEDLIYLNQKINGDSYNLIIFCLNSIQNLISNFLGGVLPFIILLKLNKSITLSMFLFIIIYCVIYLSLKDRIYKAGLEFKENQSKFFSSLYKLLEYIKLLKVNSIHKELNNKEDIIFDNFKYIAVKSQKANFIYNSLDGIISIFAQISLFFVGGLQVIKGRFTIGMFTIFSSYFNMMLSSTRYFFSFGASYQTAVSSYDRIINILNLPKETNGKEYITNITDIELKNLKFSYDYYDANIINKDMKFLNKEIIDDFSYSFKKGKIYSVVGLNGTGKSTLISLIIGLYIDEFYGDILYNKKDIKTLDMKKIRKNLIGVSEQEPKLLNETILYNICYNDNINDTEIKDIEKYFKLLNMYTFIKKNKLSFLINDNSSNLSGGEKQKISIIKVLYKNPEIMIFDEPTSAMDYKTRKRFMDYILKIKYDKIIICVTHDDKLILNSDEVIELGCN
ncbi:ABC transporter ATP-binding protein [Finegoldia magna]|uniref:ABC transporter ATP-binding protein n=1 Tax=Finegoldia magna TaxID=1260 RepID=UPI002912A546|nr:ABC transporter ATP-binding protein [Finegoldia magna]MDU5508191.1 ABC transporter ATP-binding protein [Finegoldia magna]